MNTSWVFWYGMLMLVALLKSSLGGRTRGLMVSVIALDVCLPDGLKTVMLARPAEAISVAWMAACSWVPLIYVVARAEPFPFHLGGVCKAGAGHHQGEGVPTRGNRVGAEAGK